MTLVLMRLAVACAMAVAMARLACVHALPGSDFYGSVQAPDFDGFGDAGASTADLAPTPAMEFNIQQQNDGLFNATDTTTPSDDGSFASAPTAAPSTMPPTPTPTLSPTPAPTPSPAPRDGSCQWQGYTLRHRAAKYFVGRVHRRGSIFGECDNGQLKCYEDSGVADVQSSQYREIKCEPSTIFTRQRDLDLEDRVADEARSGTASNQP